jgi:hypothetical protein
MTKSEEGRTMVSHPAAQSGWITLLERPQAAGGHRIVPMLEYYSRKPGG